MNELSARLRVPGQRRDPFRRWLVRLADSRHLGYALVAPALACLAALILAPLAYSMVLSTYSWQLTQINLPKPFVGLRLYDQVIHDAVFGVALRNTFIFVGCTVSVELVLGFLIALALLNLHRGRRLANGIILLPMIVTPVIVALIWRYLLDPQFGLIDYAAHLLGHRQDIAWLGTPSLALPSLIVIDIWEWTPFAILVLHAGMLAIPEDLYEAARVDGAGAWQIVRHVMIPFLMPLILIVLLLRTMDTYRIFDTIFVLTRGGPGLATQTVGIYTYENGFVYLNMGYAMALSIVILGFIIVISVFYLRLLQRRS
ncbi:MAG: carbohydrate ABC transporter permease [Candidatus Dormibacteraceae bacterium]